MTERTVMTVRGPVPAGELGITLPHEHLFTNMLREFRGDGLLNDIPLAVSELALFRELGGTTVVDVTTDDFGRQPKALRTVSEISGVHVVMGCGVFRHPYIDTEWLDRTSTNHLAQLIVRELEEGVGDTGIRPGIVGEIACDEWITAHEERSFRAAARAQKSTGVAITTHAARWPVGLVQLDLLEEEGVELRRVIVGHSDTVRSIDWTSAKQTMRYHERLAKRGAYVQFDTVGGNPLRRTETELQLRVDWVVNLIAHGFEDQILLSHDVALLSMMRTYGGCGYTYLLTDFCPRLEATGVSRELVRHILVENPRRALTGE